MVERAAAVTPFRFPDSGMLRDEPLAILLTQRFPPLSDVLGARIRRGNGIGLASAARRRRRRHRPSPKPTGVDGIGLRGTCSTACCRILALFQSSGPASRGTAGAPFPTPGRRACRSRGPCSAPAPGVLDDLHVDSAHRLQCAAVAAAASRINACLLFSITALACSGSVRRVGNLAGCWRSSVLRALTGASPPHAPAPGSSAARPDRQRHEVLHVPRIQRLDLAAVVLLGPGVGSRGTLQGIGLRGQHAMQIRGRGLPALGLGLIACADRPTRPHCASAAVAVDDLCPSRSASASSRRRPASCERACGSALIGCGRGAFLPAGKNATSGEGGSSAPIRSLGQTSRTHATQFLNCQ